MARVTKADWQAFDNAMERWERDLWDEAEGLVARLGNDQAEADKPSQRDLF